MPDEMDVRRLIEEVKKRPTLWDVRYAEYKDRTNTPQLWQEIADILEVDVEHCKRKWKNLRDAYRAEVRRTERRLERLKTSGQYDEKMKVGSKWVYFEPMSFINESRRAKYLPLAAKSEEGSNGSADHSPYEPGFHSFCDIKMEPHHTTTDDDDEEEDDNEKLFEEFKSVATPQAVRRLSNSISIANAVEDEVLNETAGPSCKCSKRSDDQVHFLENLEREEQKLMQSTRQDMSRASNVGHVGDSDYNFLVSFLPQMKKMCELQNLQFRAKMSELLLNIMTPCSTASGAMVSSCPSVTTMAITTQCPRQCSRAELVRQVGQLQLPTSGDSMQLVQQAPANLQEARQLPDYLRMQQPQPQQQPQPFSQTECMDEEQTEGLNNTNAVVSTSSRPWP